MVHGFCEDQFTKVRIRGTVTTPGGFPTPNPNKKVREVVGSVTGPGVKVKEEGGLPIPALLPDDVGCPVNAATNLTALASGGVDEAMLNVL